MYVMKTMTDCICMYVCYEDVCLYMYVCMKMSVCINMYVGDLSNINMEVRAALGRMIP